MRIRKKMPVAVQRFPNFNVGDIEDVPAGIAMELIGMGAAELVGDEPKPDGFKVGRETIQTRDPVAATRDPEPQAAPVAEPEPVKRGRKKSSEE